MEEEEVSAGTQEEKVSTAGMTGQDGKGQDWRGRGEYGGKRDVHFVGEGEVDMFIHVYYLSIKTQLN